MATDIDIYRSASVMISQHGQDAALEAGMRADALLDKGSVDGYRTWLRITAAVEELQRTTPREDDMFQ